MTVRLFTVAALAGTLLVAGACSQEETAESTDATTRSLLAQSVGGGVSAPSPVDASTPDANPRMPVAQVGFNRGAVEAPVKVVEMSDYGCGFCRQFHQETFPTLLTEFIETGMVEWKFVPFVTGMFENSPVATEAVECAYVQGEAAFEALNTRLWADQAEWKRSRDPGPVVRGWVSELGMDMEAFDACLANDDRIDRITAATELARQIGVRGTPTFIVIGYPPLQGALPLDTFREILRTVHAEAAGQGER
jgi:protein-disulfide isomerase